ncbi:hypothetical protein SNEBB_010177 [Seison nebaliae]|nr:hypothetical protein SNEBB_010177 [Seison nebaliae]
MNKTFSKTSNTFDTLDHQLQRLWYEKNDQGDKSKQVPLVSFIRTEFRLEKCRQIAIFYSFILTLTGIALLMTSLLVEKSPVNQKMPMNSSLRYDWLEKCTSLIFAYMYIVSTIWFIFLNLDMKYDREKNAERLKREEKKLLEKSFQNTSSIDEKSTGNTDGNGEESIVNIATFRIATAVADYKDRDEELGKFLETSIHDRSHESENEEEKENHLKQLIPRFFEKSLTEGRAKLFEKRLWMNDRSSMRNFINRRSNHRQLKHSATINSFSSLNKTQLNKKRLCEKNSKLFEIPSYKAIDRMKPEILTHSLSATTSNSYNDIDRNINDSLIETPANLKRNLFYIPDKSHSDDNDGNMEHERMLKMQVSYPSSVSDMVNDQNDIDRYDNASLDYQLIADSSIKKEKTGYFYETAEAASGLYMRVGGGIFCGCSLILFGLWLAEDFDHQNFHLCTCWYETIQHLAAFLFLLNQCFFMFQHPNIIIRRNIFINYFGTLHVVCSNICLWSKVLIEESVVERWHYLHSLTQSTQALKSSHITNDHMHNHTTINSTSFGQYGFAINSQPNLYQINSSLISELSHMNVEEIANNEDLFHLYHKQCSFQENFHSLREVSSSYLLPCTVEFVVLCLANMIDVIFRMKSRIPDDNEKGDVITKMLPSHQTNSVSSESSKMEKKKTATASTERTQRNVLFTLDCGHIARGLFLGVLVLLGTIISLIVFHMHLKQAPTSKARSYIISPNGKFRETRSIHSSESHTSNHEKELQHAFDGALYDFHFNHDNQVALMINQMTEIILVTIGLFAVFLAYFQTRKQLREKFLVDFIEQRRLEKFYLKCYENLKRITKMKNNASVLSLTSRDERDASISANLNQHSNINYKNIDENLRRVKEKLIDLTQATNRAKADIKNQMKDSLNEKKELFLLDVGVVGSCAFRLFCIVAVLFRQERSNTHVDALIVKQADVHVKLFQEFLHSTYNQPNVTIYSDEILRKDLEELDSSLKSQSIFISTIFFLYEMYINIIKKRSKQLINGHSIVFQLPKLPSPIILQFLKYKGVISLLSSMLSIIHTIFQSVLIRNMLRKRLVGQHAMRKKPGRETFTFLTVHNIALWFYHSFESKRLETNPVQIKFFGIEIWTALTHFVCPIALFYYFHSSVCIANIWNHSYHSQRSEENDWKSFLIHSNDAQSKNQFYDANTNHHALVEYYNLFHSEFHRNNNEESCPAKPTTV